MSHKLGICIPYRNRKEHLDRLIPHLSEHLIKQGIEHTFYVGHQVDDKLFNRGAMKNIAAHYAFEDGCDYVAWHDVDMLVYNKEEDGVSYEYPENNPLHISTKLSKYNYGLGYDQYFGGVVLFNKEQAYKTNGYSNEYWDWGQEDDDLFWRCYFEGLTTGRIIKTEKDKLIATFNGNDSAIYVPTNREISSCLHDDHTITLTFSAEQQEDKVPIWLVGDENKQFIEYPLLRKDGSWTWGLSFNNSRAVTMNVFDRTNTRHYNWAKRFEGMWTQVTVSYNSEEQNMYFYINDELISQMNGVKQNRPFSIKENLKTHDAIKPFMLGFCSHVNTRFKGKISDFKIYNKFFDNINDVYENTENIILNMDMNSEHIIKQNINTSTENIEIIENIVPHRREGKFYCLPHIDEGFINGKWAKGKTTARNEKRFVTEMQQGKINHKEDGLSQIMSTLEIESVDDTLYPNTKFINVKMTTNNA
jgi:hypothetical protein